MELLIPQIISFVTLFAGMGEQLRCGFFARHSVVIRQRGTGLRRLDWLFQWVDLLERFTRSVVGWLLVIKGPIHWFRVDR